MFFDMRVVWLRCRGVPLHAWEESLFSSVAEKFGTFIEVDGATANHTKLDVARVKISTSRMAFIDMEIMISVLDKKYRILVVEEPEREVVEVSCGVRRAGEWVSTVSSMASAGENEAQVIGDTLPDDVSDDVMWEKLVRKKGLTLGLRTTERDIS
jgi:hypothetical protein